MPVFSSRRRPDGPGGESEGPSSIKFSPWARRARRRVRRTLGRETARNRIFALGPKGTAESPKDPRTGHLPVRRPVVDTGCAGVAWPHWPGHYVCLHNLRRQNRIRNLRRQNRIRKLRRQNRIHNLRRQNRIRKLRRLSRIHSLRRQNRIRKLRRQNRIPNLRRQNRIRKLRRQSRIQI